MLSEQILKKRKEAGLSQEALAEQLGVSRQAVSKWEVGEANPDIAYVGCSALWRGAQTENG